MPASPDSRRKRPPTAAVPIEDDSAGREPRGARRKRETREKLLEAAFRLMAERGMDAVAINEITEAADVGFGSFYNHFESKEAIYGALMDLVFEDYADALDRLVVDVPDPAEVIAISVRHTLVRARREPLWGRLLVREGLSARSLSRGLGVRLMRDIQRGIVAGRFRIPDPAMTFVAMGGAVIAAVAVQSQIDGPDLPPGMLGDPSRDDIPARSATLLLQGLGLDHAEAQAIAAKPLPVVDAGPAP